MTDKKKREPPVKLDMPFEEAMVRFIQTDPAEVASAYDLVKTRQKEVQNNIENQK